MVGHVRKDETGSGRRELCKLLCLNIHGLVKKSSDEVVPDQRWKVEAIEEYVKENNIIIMNYTETWLDKDMGYSKRIQQAM